MNNWLDPWIENAMWFFLTFRVYIMFPVLPDTYCIKSSVNAHTQRQRMYRHRQLNSSSKLVFLFFLSSIFPLALYTIFAAYSSRRYNRQMATMRSRPLEERERKLSGRFPLETSRVGNEASHAPSTRAVDTLDAVKRNGN